MTQPDGYLPDSAFNYGSLAELAARSAEDWEAEIYRDATRGLVRIQGGWMEWLRGFEDIGVALELSAHEFQNLLNTSWQWLTGGAFGDAHKSLQDVLDAGEEFRASVAKVNLEIAAMIDGTIGTGKTVQDYVAWLNQGHTRAEEAWTNFNVLFVRFISGEATAEDFADWLGAVKGASDESASRFAALIDGLGGGGTGVQDLVARLQLTRDRADESWQNFGTLLAQLFSGQATIEDLGDFLEQSHVRSQQSWDEIVALVFGLGSGLGVGAGGFHDVTVVIDRNKVGANLTDFPVYIDLAGMPQSFWGTVKNGGGDIRVFTGVEGDDELAREVVACNTAAKTGELWVKADVSASADTKVYLSVDGARNDYPVGHQFGRNAVWSNGYLAVYHLSDTATDSTGNGNSGSNNGSTAATGKLGAARSFDGNDYINVTQGSAIASALNTSGEHTISAWAKANAAALSAQDSFVADLGTYANTGIGLLTGTRYGGRWGTYATNTFIQGTSAISVGTRYHIAATGDGSSTKLFVNGTQEKSGDPNPSITTSHPFRIGTQAKELDRYWHGVIDEVRISDVARSAAWIAAEYSNQNAPNTFYTATESASGINAIQSALSKLRADADESADNFAALLDEWLGTGSNIQDFTTWLQSTRDDLEGTWNAIAEGFWGVITGQMTLQDALDAIFDTSNTIGGHSGRLGGHSGQLASHASSIAALQVAVAGLGGDPGSGGYSKVYDWATYPQSSQMPVGVTTYTGAGPATLGIGSSGPVQWLGAALQANAKTAAVVMPDETETLHQRVGGVWNSVLTWSLMNPPPLIGLRGRMTGASYVEVEMWQDQVGQDRYRIIRRGTDPTPSVIASGTFTFKAHTQYWLELGSDENPNGFLYRIFENETLIDSIIDPNASDPILGKGHGFTSRIAGQVLAVPNFPPNMTAYAIYDASGG